MNKKLLYILLICTGLLSFWSPVVHASSETVHEDPVAPLLLALLVILLVAKGGGELFERLGMPAVLGELVGGIIIGNLVLINPAWSFFEPLRELTIEVHWAVIVDGLARLGVIILLFEVGLESTLDGMLKVGTSSFIVAILGVVAPAVLGYGISWLLIREIPPQLAGRIPAGFSLHYIHLFIGCVLCATSVGITARVFKDMKRLQTKEAQIILGAAVIDDVLGLIVLAVVSGIVTAAKAGLAFQASSIFRILGISVLFLGGALTIGRFMIPKIMNQLAKLRTGGMMLISSLLLAFLLSYLAGLAGLAAIVGAFAAGLLLEKVHFQGFREDIDIFELIRPVSTFLVPIFFVLMGIQVHLESFANLSILGLAAGITIAAIIGKQVCAYGAIEKGLDRLSIGVGMIPRGEVGLIFASIGRSMNVIDPSTFSAVVIMVIVTTLVTPPILKVTIARCDRKKIGVSEASSNISKAQ
ncbi:MAG: cation:proton antiporter [Acidobacteria bacterium]|nr:cation:proton antiporter [Acidobacteriota bacterium]